MTTSTRHEPEIDATLRGIFDAAGAEGYLHCREITASADAAGVGLAPDRPVVTASVFKLPVLLEYCRQVSAGQLAATDRVRVPAGGRTVGPSGLSVLRDEVELSLRDLAAQMISVSDNCATDVLLERVGIEAVNAGLRDLGLQQTTLVGDCRRLLGDLADDLGGREAAEQLGAGTDPASLAGVRSLDPAKTNRTTARETTTLLARIWQDTAGPAEACAETRRILGLQLFRDRLRSGFGEDVRVSSKTGTLPGIRNEAGVVELPDGHSYAVAVFTRARSLAWVQPAIDASIGAAAAAAVGHLRAQR
ncbi:MAG TPA: serine hydrolase [Streptosporangiaceae bacterium]|nr:serine hydrolase [Streptosporangiaceae bacterium]